MKPDERADLEFKASFEAKVEWPELIKDIVAMANSGGGQIWIGVNDDGTHSGADVAPVLEIDLADVINKIRGYTDINFSGIKILPGDLAGKPIACIEISAALTPLVFSKVGNYVALGGKQKAAFNQGSFYVRHGPKSEPATSDDLRTAIEQRVNEQRERLLSNLRQVIEAPTDSIVRIAAPNAGSESVNVRLVAEGNAEAAKLIDPNRTHPHRQKEVVIAVNQRLDGKHYFTSNDNLAVRRLHDIEQRPEFFYKQNYGSAIYSDAYVDYLVKMISEDPGYLENLRKSHREHVLERNARKKGK